MAFVGLFGYLGRLGWLLALEIWVLVLNGEFVFREVFDF